LIGDSDKEVRGNINENDSRAAGIAWPYGATIVLD